MIEKLSSMKVTNKVFIYLFFIAFVGFCVLFFQQKNENRIYDTIVSQHIIAENFYFDNFVALETKPSLQIIETNTFWDDMVTFAQTGDKKMATWCVEPIINLYKFNKIWLFDKTKTKTYIAVDSANFLSDFDISSAEIDLFFQHGKLSNFYIYYRGKVVEIYCATIHPSNDNKRLSPPGGYLIAAKIWNNKYTGEYL